MGMGRRSSNINAGSARRFSSRLLGDGPRRLSALRSSKSMDLQWPWVSAWAGTVWFVRCAKESGEVLNGDPGVQTITVNVESRQDAWSFAAVSQRRYSYPTSLVCQLSRKYAMRHDRAADVINLYGRLDNTCADLR